MKTYGLWKCVVVLLVLGQLVASAAKVKVQKNADGTFVIIGQGVEITSQTAQDGGLMVVLNNGDTFFVKQSASASGFEINVISAAQALEVEAVIAGVGGAPAQSVGVIKLEGSEKATVELATSTDGNPEMTVKSVRGTVEVETATATVTIPQNAEAEVSTSADGTVSVDSNAGNVVVTSNTTGQRTQVTPGSGSANVSAGGQVSGGIPVDDTTPAEEEQTVAEKVEEETDATLAETAAEEEQEEEQDEIDEAHAAY